MSEMLPGKNKKALESRFKKYVELAEAAETDEDFDDMYDSINVVLDLAVKLGHVASEPLEPKEYKVTFPGRVNGELREAA